MTSTAIEVRDRARGRDPEPGWTERVGGPVDVLLDGVGGALGLAGFGLARDGGRVSAHGAPSPQSPGRLKWLKSSPPGD
ncbi:hypothetical protein ABT084_21300 [Streptomyces sp. NPDC002138]|uniref:hypothetical protein n=1 Tax=Streptomyces sp. NPDC002138 TaxID=3154410 RepID=UPI003321F6ED